MSAKYSQQTWNVLETFLHTLYYYGISAHIGHGIVLMARAMDISPIECLVKYRADAKIRSQVDELLRNQP